MGKGMVYTIRRGINKQTYSHLHPPQFFLLIRMWIRGGKKKIGREIKRRGEKGKAQLELKWDRSSHTKSNLQLYSTPYL